MRYVTFDGVEVRDAKPSEVACPACGARAGSPCEREDGRGPATSHHKRRRESAKRTTIPIERSHVMPAATTPEVEVRPSEFNPELVRSFIHHALSHDAVDDCVKELLFDHVVGGAYRPPVIASSLKPLIDEVLEAATWDDWRAVADALVADARDTLLGGSSVVYPQDLGDLPAGATKLAGAESLAAAEALCREPGQRFAITAGGGGVRFVVWKLAEDELEAETGGTRR